MNMRFPAWINRRDKRPLRGAIVMYHRITDPHGKLSNLAVSPENFAFHLDYLADTCSVVPLSEMVKGLKRGKLPERAVVITFDDGYVDNLTQAEPLLRACALPATVYVATGFIGQRSRFWWDVINVALAESKATSDELLLHVQGKEYVWRVTSWQEKEQAYTEIARLLRSLPEDGIVRAVEAITNWAGMEVGDNPADYPMTAEELCAIESGGVVRLEAHTCTHPVLHELSREAQQVEILESRRRLEAIVNHRVENFSYPFGWYNEDTLRILRRHRFASAVSTRSAPVTEKDDLLALPRFPVEDWDIDAFIPRLEALFQ